MLLVLSSIFAAVEGSDSRYKRANSFTLMSMGAILANTSAASFDMVRKALITPSALIHIGPANKITDLITLAVKNRQLKRTQPLFAIILDKAL